MLRRLDLTNAMYRVIEVNSISEIAEAANWTNTNKLDNHTNVFLFNTEVIRTGRPVKVEITINKVNSLFNKNKYTVTVLKNDFCINNLVAEFLNCKVVNSQCLVTSNNFIADLERAVNIAINAKTI